MTTRITQRELENYLWGAAVVLRGLIDAGDYKQYIFPLVFLKRISDVYDEEHSAAMAIYDDEELADLAARGGGVRGNLLEVDRVGDDPRADVVGYEIAQAEHGV